MAVIGTAGHVDHGKSTLVLALTGIDPDRLAEEKRRGMTIDLGFAHLDLPSGERVGIVDVPGHSRFLHNMLAGVHGMDAVLLVVAADEGVMPQTREHLDILQLLGVERLVVALTKVDLVDHDMLAMADLDVREELGRRGLRGQVIPVSAPSGAGLDMLISALTELVAAAATVDRGRPRLPVDRSFTMPGFGAVVTGTLVDGVLRVGQTVELVPGDRDARLRVRGLQQHGRPVTEARPGSRVAVNLQGVDHRDVRRGQVLAPPGTQRETARIDALVRTLAGGGGLRHNSRVRLHTGTAEVPARVVLLESERLVPGAQGWVQLLLATPAAIRDGDRVVLRRLSPAETLAGGEVVDAGAPAHRRTRSAEVVEALRVRGDLRSRILQALERARQGATVAEVAGALAEAPQTVEAVLEGLGAGGDVVSAGGAFWSRERWAALEAQARRELDAYHRENPLRPGMPAEELRRRIGIGSQGSAEAFARMAREGLVDRAGQGLVALAGWEPRLTDAQRRAAEEILARLTVAPLAPPRLSELGAGAEDICRLLEGQGRLVRIASDLYVLPEAIEVARAALERRMEGGASLTVAEARDVLGSSRKVVVPLLEHFDRAHVTVREGDLRRLWRDPNK